MLKFFGALIIMVILTTSCEEDWNETTIQVINTIEAFETEIDDYNGTAYNASIYCFRGDDPAESISVGNIAPGDSSEVIVLDKEVTKAKVSFTLLPGPKIYRNMYWNFRYYDVVFHYLEKNEHHEIIVSEKTMMSTKLFLETGEKEIMLDSFQ